MMLEEGTNNDGGASNNANPDQAELGQPAQQWTAWYWKIVKPKEVQSEPEYAIQLKKVVSCHGLLFLVRPLSCTSPFPNSLLRNQV